MPEIPSHSRKLHRPGVEKIPAYVVFVDTETEVLEIVSNGERIDLLLGCYECWKVDNKGRPEYMAESGTFYLVDGFYDVISRYLPCRVLAHNWRFDAAVLRIGSRVLQAKHGYRIDLSRSIVPAGQQKMSPFLLRLEFQSGSAEMICNTNWYKIPLASLGQSYGIEKMEMPKVEDYREYDDYVIDLETYCQRDVEILRRAYFFLFGFTAEIADTTPGITAAMAANRVWRRKYMPGITIQGSLGVQYVREVEMLAYKGGRTDVFFRGVPDSGKVYKYDVNSLYPYAMSGNVPIRYLQPASDSMMIEAIEREGSGYQSDVIYLGKVNVDIPADSAYGFIGVEGIRSRDGLIFPAGRYQTWAWQPIVEILLECGYLKTIDHCLAYDAANLFGGYVADLYSRRQEYKANGDTARELLVKLFMNSLYGKFGQRHNPNWRSIPKGDYEYQVMAEPESDMARFDGHFNDVEYEYLQLGNDLWAIEVNGERIPGRDSVPSISGYITSMGRAILWRGLAAGLDSGARLYLCDTDSIMLDRELPPEMVNQTALGAYKLEEVVDAVDSLFIAPKHYQIGGKWRIKGIRYPDDSVSFKQAVFPNFITDLTSRSAARRARLEQPPVIAEVIKTPTGRNNKRLESEENQPTLPLVLTGSTDV